MKIAIILSVIVIAVLMMLALRRSGKMQLLSGNRDHDLARVLPRLVTQEFIEAGQAQLKQEIPHRSFFNTGLSVVYVLDNPETVAYVTRSMVEQLKLNDTELHELALSNLTKLFPLEVIESIVVERQMCVIKGMDGHDAARLILLPEFLKEGENVAVTIPDADTLSICPVPNDWNGLRDLAKNPASRPLFAKPLKVSRGSVIVIE
jgi:hypothetical protein